MEYAYPSQLDKVARDFRGTNILLAHFGKPWMNETVELMMKNRNVFADVSTLPIKPWQMYNGLRLAIEGHVTDRLVFGSDFPSFDPRDAANDFLAIAELDMPLPIPRRWSRTSSSTVPSSSSLVASRPSPDEKETTS